jgi:hypothetical protein
MLSLLLIANKNSYIVNYLNKNTFPSNTYIVDKYNISILDCYCIGCTYCIVFVVFKLIERSNMNKLQLNLYIIK